MDRRHLLGGSVVVALTGLADRAVGLPLGRGEVYHSPESIAIAASSLKATDLSLGGGRRLSEARRASHGALQLLDTHPSLKRALATSWLVSTTGFMAFDSGRMGEAARWLSLAHSAALESGNASMEARILGQMARLAIWDEHPVEALARVEEAQALPGLTPVEHSMLWALKARALAQFDLGKDVDQAADMADVLLAEGSDTEDRPWVGHFDQAHLCGDLGSAYKTLVLRFGRRAVTMASGRQERAVELHHTPRSKAMSLVSLATIDVAAGDVEHGIQSGMLALEAAQGMKSWRLRQSFDALLTELTPYQARSDARELMDQVTMVVG